MSHNALIRGPGLWTGIVTSGEWETFDTRQFQSINGDLGGTWAPASLIIIGGLGMRVTAPFETTGQFTATGNALIQGSALVVTAPSIFADTIDFTGVLTIENDVTIQGAGTLLAIAASALTPTFASGLHVTANTSTFDDSVICNDTLSVHNNLLHDVGVASFSATTSLGGTVNLQSLVTVGVGGVAAGIKKRVKFTGGITTTILANTYDLVQVSAPSGNVDLVLNDAPEGSEIEISMQNAGSGSGTNQVFVKRQSGSVAAVLEWSTSGFASYVHMVVQSGNWSQFKTISIP